MYNGRFAEEEGEGGQEIPNSVDVIYECPLNRLHFQDQLQSTKTKGFLPHVKILPFRSVVHSGEAMRDRVVTVAPTPDDTAIVMYTSGSTGTPKVLIITVPFSYFISTEMG